MRKITSLLLGLLVTWSASADVVIYTQKVKVTKTGGGTVIKSPVTGFYVWDVQTADFYVISVFDSRHRFVVLPPAVNDFVANIETGKGYGLMVLSYFSTGNGFVTAQGSKSLTDIAAATNNYAIPKTLKLTGSNMYPDTANEAFAFVEAYTGTLAYNATDTESFNKRSLTLNQAVAEIKTRLLALGLTEE